MHFVEKVTYTTAQKDLNVHREDPELPPVIAPVLRGSVVTNTEHLKKSVYLQNMKNRWLAGLCYLELVLMYIL